MSIRKRNRKKRQECVSKSKKSKKPNTKSRKKEQSSKQCNNERPSRENNHSEKKITVEKARHPCPRYEEFHDHFLAYDKITSFLSNLMKNSPGTIEVVTIGKSGQGKPIYMALITTECSSKDPKCATFVVAGLKGDDTIAVSNALYMIDHLCKHPNNIKIMDYFIVPCANPDAYDAFIKSNEEQENKCTRSRSYCRENETKTVPDSSKCGNNKDPKKPFKSSSSRELSDSQKNQNNNCPTENVEDDRKEERLCRPCCKKRHKKPCKSGDEDKNRKSYCAKEIENMDLTLNFPVVLGLNDMKKITTNLFLEKLKVWKENYIFGCPETRALVEAINNYQFAIKMLISLQEGGQAICYPYGFCSKVDEDSNDLKEIARKGKTAITGRQFQFGSIHDIMGLTYGSLIDFLKIDKWSIKYMYNIHVYKKATKDEKKKELQNLMTYGCEIMECIKRMSACVFKFYTDMTGNKQVETASTKPGLDRKSCF